MNLIDKTLLDYEIIANKKLQEAKEKVKLFAMDYDGTLADGEEFKKEEAIGLIGEILNKAKIPAFITARAATAIKTFVPGLKEYYQKHSNSTPTYIAGGNGTVLYSLTLGNLEQIYSHGLSIEEIKEIVKKWEEYSKDNLVTEDLSEKGVVTFQKFNQEKWEGLIPEKVLNIGKRFEGRIFTEEAKVTFVLSKDLSIHLKVVEDMQKLVGNNFSVVAGDKDFCHITKKLSADSKLSAVKTILEIEGLKEDEIVTFGDMPHGNDKGLLSFPYSFTNYAEVLVKTDFQTPPFVLSEEGLSPVGRVHKAIQFLLS